MINRFKKDVSQFNKRPIREYLEYQVGLESVLERCGTGYNLMTDKFIFRQLFSQ